MAGTITRAQLLGMVRDHLSAWPEPAVLAQAVTPNASNLPFTDSIETEFLHPKSVLQVGNELMRVIDIPAGGLNVRVIRGYRGTTKASHAQFAPVAIHPSWGWSDYELLNSHMPLSLKFLKPMFWTYQTSDTFTWASDSYTATVPASSGISYPDGNHIHRLLYLDNNNKYRPFSSWRILGDTIHFREKAISALTLKAEFLKFQGALASDSTTLDLDDCAEPLALYIASLALNSLKTNRVRFAEYSAALNDRASTPDELIRIAFDLRNQATVAREERGRVPPGDYVSTYRD